MLGFIVLACLYLLKSCFIIEFLKKLKTKHFLFTSKQFLNLLAHLSQRLIGELIGYSWSGVRPSSSVRPSVVNNFKRLLLRNRWADQSQILCGASLGRGNEILFAAFGSHDQDGRHAHIWSKPFKNLLLQNRRADFHKT